MAGGEEEKREIPREEETLASPVAMVVEDEEEDEEERIERFFQLVKSINEMKKEIQRSTSLKRDRTVLQYDDHLRWKPRFIMEDFNILGRRETSKPLKDVWKKRKVDEIRVNGEGELNTDLELRLGS